MPFLLRRLGITARRAVVALVLLLVVGVGAWLVAGSGAQGVSGIDLRVLDGEGDFSQVIRVDGDSPLLDRTVEGGTPRILLAVGLRNGGSRPVRPVRLDLAVPIWWRLEGGRGDSALRRRPADGPLTGYVVRGRFPELEPRQLPVPLPGLDSLWLSPRLRRWRCVVVSDSVPEVVPALPPPASGMADVRIFWDLHGAGLHERRTGLITVRVDSTLLALDVPPAPARGAVELRAAGYSLPDTGALVARGDERVDCGAPGEPVPLDVRGWDTAAGGVVLRLSYGGVARKYLLDSDGDGIVEQEIWDPDGDGRFEARRSTRLPLPDFLVPSPSPVPPAAPDMAPAAAGTDTVPPPVRAPTQPFEEGGPP